MPLARGFLRMETVQDLGAVMNGIGLLDEQVVCTGDNWTVGVGARNGRRRCQARWVQVRCEVRSPIRGECRCQCQWLRASESVMSPS